jgi:hypothetical protein
MEVSLTEVWLFAWAVLATAGYFNAKQDAKVAREILRHFIENPKARAEMLETFERFKKKVETL